MTRFMLAFAAVAGLLLTTTVGCGGGKSSGPVGPGGNDGELTKKEERARTRLGEMNVPFTTEAFIRAIENEDILVIELFIDAGMDPNTKNTDGKPVLAWAAINGKMVAVDVLMRKGATEGIITVLVEAIRDGDEARVNALLANGVDPSQIDPYSKRTPLSVAAANGQAGVVQILLAAGADVNAKDDLGRTALMRAAQDDDNIEALRALLAAGADVNAADTQGVTALMWAADEVALAAVEELIAAGADVNAADARGATALMWANGTGTEGEPVVRALKEAGAVE